MSDGSYPLRSDPVPQQARPDPDRHNQLWIMGDRVLRFPAWLVRDQVDGVVDTHPQGTARRRLESRS